MILLDEAAAVALEICSCPSPIRQRVLLGYHADRVARALSLSADVVRLAILDAVDAANRQPCR